MALNGDVTQAEVNHLVGHVKVSVSITKESESESKRD